MLFIDKEIYKRSKAMKVNVKEVDIFKKWGMMMGIEREDHNK